MPSGQVSRLGYIHALRGVAILMIVGAHTNSFAPIHGGWAEAIYRAFLREGTALFVLISGFLFQHLHARYCARGFWQSKVRNVALPYVIMSIPAIVLDLAVIPDPGRLALAGLDHAGPVYQAAYLLLTGASLLPFWFIPVLLLIFACYPLLRVLAAHDRLKYVVFICLISLIFTERAANNMNPLVSFAHFLPVYIIGMGLYRYWDEWILAARRYFWPLALLLLIVFVLACIYNDPFVDSSVSIAVKMLVFVLVCARCATLDFAALARRSRTVRLCNYLASLSFAIYFIHGYIAAIVARSPLTFPLEHGGLAVLLGILNAGLVTALSVAVAEGARGLLASRSRMVVGA